MLGPIRDRALLDSLERLPQQAFSGTVWRSVRAGRDPVECASAGGRWDDRSFDVLYTSLAPEGAIEERRFHLFRGQPIPPSKASYELFELHVKLSAVISFTDLEALRAICMDKAGYGAASYVDRTGEYPGSQVVAEACFFLGADGIVVPNARHPSQNLIVFCEQETDIEVEPIRSHGLLEWSR